MVQSNQSLHLTAAAFQREKGTSLNSTCLTPKPLASSVYVHVPEAPSSRNRAILVTSLFHSFLRIRYLYEIWEHERVWEGLAPTRQGGTPLRATAWTWIGADDTLILEE